MIEQPHDNNDFEYEMNEDEEEEQKQVLETCKDSDLGGHSEMQNSEEERAINLIVYDQQRGKIIVINCAQCNRILCQ
jgi:hypothetical protein